MPVFYIPKDIYILENWTKNKIQNSNRARPFNKSRSNSSSEIGGPIENVGRNAGRLENLDIESNRRAHIIFLFEV